MLVHINSDKAMNNSRYNFLLWSHKESCDHYVSQVKLVSHAFLIMNYGCCFEFICDDYFLKESLEYIVLSNMNTCILPLKSTSKNKSA